LLVEDLLLVSHDFDVVLLLFELDLGLLVLGLVLLELGLQVLFVLLFGFCFALARLD
jgi:hypothetical protein